MKKQLHTSSAPKVLGNRPVTGHSPTKRWRSQYRRCCTIPFLGVPPISSRRYPSTPTKRGKRAPTSRLESTCSSSLQRSASSGHLSIRAATLRDRVAGRTRPNAKRQRMQRGARTLGRLDAKGLDRANLQWNKRPPRIRFSERNQPFPAGLSAHLEPKAKNVIVWHSTGGPSQVDVFDPRSLRANCEGEAAPEEFAMGTEFGFMWDQP